jgi:hypothetical protein
VSLLAVPTAGRPATDVERPGRGRVAPGPGSLPAAVGLVTLVAGLAAGSPALVLLAMTAVAAGALGGRLPMDLAVPAGALALLLLAVCSGLVAGVLDVDLLAFPWLLASVYLVLAVAVLAWAARRTPPPRQPAAPHSRWFRLVHLPAVVALVTGLLQAASLGTAKSWSFWGTDLSRHMTVVARLQTDGSLDYAVWPYPRGLHMLAALASVPGAPVADPGRLMGYDLQLWSALTWFALALMICTATALAVRMATALGLHPAVGPVAALLVGAGALLTNTFVLSFVFLGAAPSLAAVAVLHGIPLTLLAARGRGHRLATTTLTCAAATVALAHLWQALVLAPVVAWAVLAAPDLLRVGRDLRQSRTRRPLLLAVLGAGVLAVLAAPPVLGVSQTAGLSYAAVPGELAGDPWRLLVPGLVAVAVLAVVRRRDAWARACAATTVGMLAATAALLRGTEHPLDLDQYYPQKSAWFLALFLAPVLAVGSAAVAVACARWGWALLGRTGRFATVLRATAAATVFGPLLALLLGYLVGVEASTVTAWHRAVPATDSRAPTREMSALRYDVALRYGAPGRDEVVVPWFVGEAPFDQFGTRTISLLLWFQTGQPEIRGDGDVCRDIIQVAGSRRAVVISQMPPARVREAMAFGGCAGRARVEHVPMTGYVG